MLSKIILTSALLLNSSANMIRTYVKPVVEFIPSKKKNNIIKRNKHKHIVKQSGMILYNLTDKQMIQSKNKIATMAPASLTKMMTFYAAIKAIEMGKASLNDTITISKQAAIQPSCKFGVTAGTKISLRDAIKGMMIISANDFAYAVGEHLFKNKVEIVLNKYAHELGLKNTVFGHATGLHHKKDVTTPKDMLKLVVAIRRFYPSYLKLTEGSKFCFKGICKGSTNKLIGRVQGVQGLKTGFLAKCGFHLVTYSKLAGKEFVGIFMGHGSARERNDYATKVLKQYHRHLFDDKNLLDENKYTKRHHEICTDKIIKKAKVKNKVKVKVKVKKNHKDFINSLL